MNTETRIDEALKHLGIPLAREIKESSEVKVLKAQTELLREGQYIKVIPIVISGLIKVFTKYEDRELLLYYIQPAESCIMSFSACLNNDPSQIFAIAEAQSEVLLLPVDKASYLMKDYPNFNKLFFQLYNKRYSELLDTINHVLFDKMDKRLYDHLKSKILMLNENPIKISHQRLANELGTVREVVSRLLKKLESEGYLTQGEDGILLKDVT